jgi:hypothetical protein
MSRPLLLSLFLLAAAPLAGAQAEPSSQEALQAPDERLKAIVDRYNKKRSEVIDAYRAAKTDEERSKILEGMPGADFVPDFRALAEEAGQSDAAVKAWLWVFRLSESAEEKREVLGVLTHDHVESSAMEELPGSLRYAGYDIGNEAVVDALRLLFEGSPVRSVQGNALFVLGAVLTDMGDKHAAEGRECFEVVATDFADVPYRSGTLKDAASGFLFEMDNLQIGMVAPDFEAIDENGVAWKLSDYRGKVTIIDFWGYW